MPDNVVKISTINDLFYYFEKLENAEVESSSVELAIDDFLTNFRFVLKYNDSMDRLRGTIDASLASSIIDVQEFIYDLYKKIRYQDQDVNLSEEERSALRIYVKISEGSTTEIIENLREISGVLFNNMTGKQKIVALSILAMVLTVGYLGTDYISYLESSKKIEVELEEDRLENERTQMIINGFSKVKSEIDSRPLYKEAVKTGQRAVLKPVRRNNSYTLTPSDNLDEEHTINQRRYIVDAEKAKRILKQKRSSAETSIVTDNYYVRSIEALEDNQMYKIKLISSSSEISGLVEIDASDEDIDIAALSTHLSSRLPLDLTARTKTLNGTTTVDKLIATLTDDED